jgi:hypothetical protein
MPFISVRWLGCQLVLSPKSEEPTDGCSRLDRETRQTGALRDEITCVVTDFRQQRY